MLHIDTESKPEVKGSSLKVRKKDHSAAGILDLLQASKQVGGIDYSTNRYPDLPSHHHFLSRHIQLPLNSHL